ncbi:MAG: hypothetical protein KDA25_00145 [Phycisphaerales bacterium]|nr:hypothetical protein [Phycisphaerales bacterium]
MGSTALLASGTVMCGLVAATWIGAANEAAFASAPRARVAAPATRPNIESLADYSLQALALPATSDAPFDVALSLDGVPVVLHLSPYSMRSSKFQVLVQEADGHLYPYEVGAPRTVRGQVDGVPGSEVAGSLLDGQLHAMILLDEMQYFVQPVNELVPGSDPTGMAHVVYATEQTRHDGIHGCGVTDDGAWQVGEPGDGSKAPAQGGVADAGDEICEIACDADTNFLSVNGGSVNNTVSDIENILMVTEVVYERDVDISYEVTTIIVRTAEPDPYTQFTAEGLLCEFRNQWNSAPENSIARDVAQLFTGKNLSGTTIGLAWIGTVCNESGFDCSASNSLAYSIVESRYTTNLNLRVSLSSHELGHNWNSPHCSGSGCHIMCSANGGCGGVSGANLKFGTSSQNIIEAFRNTRNCLTPGVDSVPPPFFDDFEDNSLQPVDWIYNRGAQISTNAENEPSGTRSLRLNKGFGDFGFDDIRTNEIQMNGQSGYTISFWYEAIGVNAGEQLKVDYWAATDDWVNVTTITSDGNDMSNFEFFSVPMPGNGYHSEFRLRFQALVSGSSTNWYVDDVRVDVPEPAPGNNDCANATFLNDNAAFSTDGTTTDGLDLPASCDEGTGLAIQNDVWFNYTPDCSGVVTVSTCGAADFDTRLAAYLDNGSCPPSNAFIAGCNDDGTDCAGGTSSMTFDGIEGLPYLIRIGSASGATGSGTVSVSCTVVVDCPTDLDGDETTGPGDLAILLGAWGTNDPQADLDKDGTVGAADLAILLGNWGDC